MILVGRYDLECVPSESKGAQSDQDRQSRWPHLVRDGCRSPILTSVPSSSVRVAARKGAARER